MTLSDLTIFGALSVSLFCLYGGIECCLRQRRRRRRRNGGAVQGNGGVAVGDVPRSSTSGTEERRRDAIEYAARRMEASRAEHVLKHLVTTTVFLADDGGVGSSKDVLVEKREDDGGSETESTSSGTGDEGSNCTQSANTTNDCELSVQEVIIIDDCSGNRGKSDFALPAVSSISDGTAPPCGNGDPAEVDLESGGRPGPRDGLGVPLPSECSICLLKYATGEEVCSSTDPTTCVHVFHRDCIVRWLIQNDECPCCRANLLSTIDRSEVVDGLGV